MTVADGTQILRAAAQLSSECELAICDVDGNGRVTVADAVNALRIVAGLSAEDQCVGLVCQGAMEGCGATRDCCQPDLVCSDGSCLPIAPGSAIITFTVNSTAAIQGFDISIMYPTSKGGFRGSAEVVDCFSEAPAFTKNDNDEGTLTVIAANTSNLTFPITIACIFDETQAISASDITPTVNEVTQNGAPGDKTQLAVDVSITQQ